MQRTAGGKTVRVNESAAATEPRWHAAVAIAVALALYVTLPPKIVVGPYWLLPLLVLAILIPLLLSGSRRAQGSKGRRVASIVMIAILNAFNVATIGLFFLYELNLQHHKEISGTHLLATAAQIWLTNILVYSLWFWEVDGDGADARAVTAFDSHPECADFLFPQMALTNDIRAKLNWKPQFIDYVFLAFTNATAFSPTDTFALSTRAKILMMAEALMSLVTVAIMAGRAVNILGGS